MVSKVLNSRYLLWLLLALPAFPFLDEFVNPTRYYPEMMQRSGILSIQLLVFTLSITPITLLIKRFYWGRALARWLLARRKYVGLAAAGYALVHTLLYLRYISWDWQLAWLEGLDFPFLTGWVAMILFIIIALVSNTWGMKQLGKSWKTVQRLSYPVAVFGFAHWLLLDIFVDDALVWIIPLVIAKSVHLFFRVNHLFPIQRIAKKN